MASSVDEVGRWPSRAGVSFKIGVVLCHRSMEIPPTDDGAAAACFREVKWPLNLSHSQTPVTLFPDTEARDKAAATVQEAERALVGQPHFPPRLFRE